MEAVSILDLNQTSIQIIHKIFYPIRHVHGLVRFSLNYKNQPNRLTQIFKNSNRTEPNRFG